MLLLTFDFVPISRASFGGLLDDHTVVQCLQCGPTDTLVTAVFLELIPSRMEKIAAMTYGHERIIFLRCADDLVNIETRLRQSARALSLFVAANAQIRQIAVAGGELVRCDLPGRSEAKAAGA